MIRVRKRARDELAEECANGFLRWMLLLEALDPLSHRARGIPLQSPPEQLALVAEGIVEARLVDARRLGEIPDGGRLEATTPEALDSRIEHLLLVELARACQG